MDTRQRILDAAEALFASHGFAGTSLRMIVAEAGVNIAAVHYHFGSKEALLRAALDRIVTPANRERLDLLAQAEAAAGDRPPAVEAILEAFIAPDLRTIRELGPRGVLITRFLGRSYTEPTALVQKLIQEQFADLGERFLGALARALPGIPREELYWRLHYAVGVITYLLAGGGIPDPLAPADLERTTARLVAFLAPGMSAPVPRLRAPNPS